MDEFEPATMHVAHLCGERNAQAAALQRRLRDSLAGGTGEAIEEAFLAFYVHLHGHEAPYTPEERQRVRATGGYWCHAGGLSPILKAPDFLGEEATAIDLGAGNGLQLLLMQVLAETSDPRSIEEAGLRLPAPGLLYWWARALINHRHWSHP